MSSSFVRGFVIMTLLLSSCPTTDSQTLDQLIVGAAEDVHALDFMSSEHSESVLVELDMRFLNGQYEEFLALNASGIGSRKRNALRDTNYRWTDNVIPYEIAAGVFDSKDLQEIHAAMNEWALFTCISFRQATIYDVNKIKYVDGSGCSSFVGMVGNQQQVTLAGGCRTKGIIAHELGHAIGFHHEQTRPDRDDHVQIIYENIPDNTKYNFRKYSWGLIDDFGVPYDYESVMHYGGTAFSSNGGLTIKTNDPAYQNVIGNRQMLSFRDMKLANKMLNCKPVTCALTDDQCTGEGFVNKLCQCVCPGNNVNNPVVVCQAGNTGTSTITNGASISAGTGIADCVDLNPNCPLFGIQLCTINPSFMHLYCRSFCKVCGGNVAPVCRNEHVHCDAWAGMSFCVLPQYAHFMVTNCKLSCGLCVG